MPNRGSQSIVRGEVSERASPDNASFILTPLQRSVSDSYKFTDKATDDLNQTQWPFHRQGNLSQRLGFKVCGVRILP